MSAKADPVRRLSDGQKRRSLSLLTPLGFCLLAACSGWGSNGNGDDGTPPTGVDVDTPAFESYTRDDNSFNRIRLDKSTTDDAAILAQFEDSDPSTPDGYRELIQLSDALYDGKMIIEVIGEAEEGSNATRILRITADEEPFENVKNNELITASGKFYLRGQNYAWVKIGDGDLLTGAKADAGLVNLVLDFDAQTATINLITGVEDGSEVRTEVTGTDLPFNIVTGAYGGAIAVQVWDPDSSLIYDIDGSLRGNVGGSATYTDGTHGLTTSGVYTASGTDEGTTVTVDGVYFGTDPNALSE